MFCKKVDSNKEQCARIPAGKSAKETWTLNPTKKEKGSGFWSITLENVKKKFSSSKLTAICIHTSVTEISPCPGNCSKTNNVRITF